MGQGTDVVGGRDDEALDHDTGSTAQTAAIRDNIAQTRGELAGTIDALQQKLDPQVVSEQVKEKVRGAVRETARDRVEQVRGTAQELLTTAQSKVRAMTSSSGGATASGGASSTLSGLGMSVRQGLERLNGLSEEEPGVYSALMVLAGLAVIGLAWIVRSRKD